MYLMRFFRKYLFGFISLFTYHTGYSCAVCLGNITKDEIIAYTFSIFLLIGILVAIFYLIFRKISKNYDIDL